MNNYDLIREAILEHYQVLAMYGGHYREMCPHTLGTKRGRRHALLYQFGGTSSSGLGPPGSRNNWRCLDVNDLSEVRTQTGGWHTAPNHSRPQSCVDHIDVEVDY